MDKGRTLTIGPEDKKVNDDMQVFTPKRKHRQTMMYQEKKWEEDWLALKIVSTQQYED